MNNQPLTGLAVNLPVSVDELRGGRAFVRGAGGPEIGFSATRTSNLVVDLCKRGYLKQRVAPNDRRRRYLGLTELGEEKLALIEQQLPEILDQTLTELRGTTRDFG